MLAKIEIDRRRPAHHLETRIFAFGRFRLDVAQRQLIASDSAVVDLPSRAFDLLLYMVQRPGELVDKSTLLKAIWPTTIVEENNLSHCIFTLRRALGDTAQEPRYIVTVPGRGYQFVAQVQSEAARADVLPPAPAPAPAPASSARSADRRVPWLTAGISALALIALLEWRPSVQAETPGSRTHTVVILPFADFSTRRDMKYFTDGMAEELTVSLTRVGSIRVVGSRYAAAIMDTNVDARAIGAKLKADSVLEGSVRKAGERIRVSARLVRTHDGVSLWSETYDLRFDDVIDIQSRIATEMAAALSPKIAAASEARAS